MNRAPMNRAPNDLFTYIGPSFNIIDICFVYVSHVCPGPATEPGPEAIPSDPALYRPAYSQGFTLLSRQHQSIASFNVDYPLNRDHERNTASSIVKSGSSLPTTICP